MPHVSYLSPLAYMPPMESPTARRKIWKRERRGETHIQPRDIEIFALLNRHYALRSSFIEAFVGGNSMALRFRLRDLYDNGYLNRPEQQWNLLNARYMPIIYTLDSRGAHHLKAAGRHSQHTSGTTRPGRDAPHRNFAHDLMIVDIIASIELGVRAAGKQFISSQQILERSPPATRASTHPFRLGTARAAVVPDAMFGIRHEGRVDFFCLEADRENEPLTRKGDGTSIQSKLANYRTFISLGAYKAHFLIPNLRLLTVTLSHRHMQGMMEVAGKADFLFYKAAPELAQLGVAPKPTPAFFTDPWHLAGGNLAHIN